MIVTSSFAAIFGESITGGNNKCEDDKECYLSVLTTSAPTAIINAMESSITTDELSFLLDEIDLDEEDALISQKVAAYLGRNLRAGDIQEIVIDLYNSNEAITLENIEKKI